MGYCLDDSDQGCEIGNHRWRPPCALALRSSPLDRLCKKSKAESTPLGWPSIVYIWPCGQDGRFRAKPRAGYTRPSCSMAMRRGHAAWRTGNDLKSSTKIACAASKIETAAIGFRAQFSANAYSYRLCQLFCCCAIFVGSVTLPAEHLVNLCES